MKRHLKEFEILVETMGKIEAMIAAASFRVCMGEWCVPVLLTGSNASGKSTFLKTVGVNAILAQTAHTCLADCWESSYFRVFSSMALKDNLEGQESYYIVEIRSLKRILEDYYDNYHFQEEVKERDICFDYRLYPGRATSRNAIRLLRIMGYDENVIRQAENAAEYFLESGEWRKMSSPKET